MVMVVASAADMASAVEGALDNTYGRGTSNYYYGLNRGMVLMGSISDIDAARSTSIYDNYDMTSVDVTSLTGEERTV